MAIKVSQSKFIAAKLLSAAAAKNASITGAFSGWILTGIGAALGLLVVNYDKLSDYLSIASIRSALIAYVFAFFLALVVRYLTTAIIGGNEIREHANEIGYKYGLETEMSDDEAELFLMEVYAEVRDANWYPARWYIQKIHKGILQGDFALGPRILTKMAQAIGLLVLLQTLLHLYSIVAIVRGLAVAQ